MTGGGNWTWLIAGAVPTLIDAGTGETQHLAAVAAALERGGLAQVLVTHAHVDHISGAPALAARFPAARFHKMPWPERDGRWPVPWEPLADGSEIAAGDDVLTSVHTPGHAPDHLSFWHAGSRTIFSGDLVVKGTTVYIPARLGGDLTAYLHSLQRLIELEPLRLLPAHGAVIYEPVEILRSYIAHRLEREAQILEALRGGAHTAPAIVTRVYRGLKESLAALAAESVEAHLVKLERDGRAHRDAEAWHIIEP